MLLPPFRSTMTKDLANATGVVEAVSYAVSHGIVVAQAANSAPGTNLSHAPITFRPTPVHAPSYHHAKRITPSLNALVTGIASNHDYLRQVLAETAAADADFTGRLLKLLGIAPTNSVDLSICRYDYFVNHQDGVSSLRMVEMNCIAASFASLGTKTSHMHRFLATHPACNHSIDVDRLPQNTALSELARGLALAHNEYMSLNTPTAVCRTAMAMVVQPGERNAYDQDILRATVWQDHQIEVLRVSLSEINSYGAVEDGHLILTLPSINVPVLVTVAYFRAGYTPDDYRSEKEWNARELIERSLAAKCPSVAVQLVGTKKIQQILDNPGEVERFVPAKEAEDIRKTFARQYSLSAAENSDKVVKMALDAPDDFVLKPQREGGGNNLYSEDMKQALLKMSPDERSAYVLMERIRPVVVSGILIRESLPIQTDIVSELGVYGVHVTRQGVDVENFTAGTLLRSKAASQDDGGVAAGVAVLDSPMLID